MHEHTQQYSAPVIGSSDKTFGIVFAIFFALIAAYPLLGGQKVRAWALVLAGIFLLLALFMPKTLGPGNRVWMRFGMLLHSITSPIALGILFYLVVMPIGLLMRLFSKNPLRLRFDPMADSYWIKREPPGPAADSLNNQF